MTKQKSFDYKINENNDEYNFYVNETNKNDTVAILGQPSTKGMVDDNLWIYIERTRTRGKLLKFGRNYLIKNNVLVLEFDKYGILNKKALYKKDDMKKLNFAEAITENDVRKENFIYSFFFFFSKIFFTIFLKNFIYRFPGKSYNFKITIYVLKINLFSKHSAYN